MTLNSSVRRNIALAALFSLILALLPFGPHVESARATAGTGAITIVSTGGTPAGTDWTFSSETITTVDGDPASINASDVVGYLNSGNLTIQGASITVNASVVATTGSSSLTLSTTGDIDVKPAISLTTLGGNMSLLADSEGNGVGGIRIGTYNATDSLLTSNGGDITLAGGGSGTSGSGNTGFAGLSSFSQDNYRFSIGVLSATVNAGGGDIVVKGYGGSVNTGFVWCVQVMDTLRTSGSGTVLVNGDCGSTPANATASLSQSGVGTRVTSTIETASGAITVIGRANVARTNARGISWSGTAQSTSGTIVIRDETANTSDVNYTGLYFYTAQLGQGGLGSSSSDVSILADEIQFETAGANPLSVNTTGTLTIAHAGSDFSSTLTIPSDLSLSNISGLTLGSSGNTQNIEIEDTFTVGGTLTIFSNGAVSQSAAVTATSLSLNGSGSFTLTNTSNNFGTIAGGASGSKLGSVSVYDASGGLTIGTVGSLEGITAAGDVLVETGSGDITVAKSITTDSTSGTAITLNAGKSTAAGSGTGGDIIVSGTPTVMTGDGGITRLFSGVESDSTGLSSLVGSANVRYRVDEANVNQFTLSSGSKYALYRTNLFDRPLKSLFVGGTEIESGKRLPSFVNGSTAVSTSSLGAVRGCFAFSVNGVTPTPSVAGSVWVGNPARQFTSSSGFLEEYVTVFWTNRNPVSGVVDTSAPNEERCAALATNFQPDVRSNTVTIFPEGTLTPSDAVVSASVGSAISTVTMAPSPSRPSGAISYSVSPSLPTGLSLNSSTGSISGTPTTETTSATYTVSAVIVAGVITTLPSTTTSQTIWDATTDVVLSVGKEIPSLSSLSNRAVTLGASPVSLTAPSATDQSSASVAGSVSWSSSNSSVASILGSTLTYASVGTAVVTATFTPSDTSTYQSATTTFTVTVSAAGGGGGSSSSSSSGVVSSPPAAPPITPRQTRLTLIGPNTDPVPRPVQRLGLRFDADAPSRATVGGAPANLVKIPVGSDGLSVTAGAFQFGVSLADADGAEVQTDTPSQSPELFVPRGQSAAVSGKGSYPGSFVQLFLPGNGNDSRELARIPVRSDGTFASDLSFEAGALELPVPIGRQVLQVVGYDERGNQTVVDMTINIGQGVPAPEPNRQAGALPALTAGQSLATSGGITETVTVTGVPETGNVVVEGSGWVVSVNADRDNGVVETSDGNVLVRLNPSSVGTTSGNGFLPGTLATVWLFSEPTLVATVSVNDAGEFSAEFLVDARLIAPGEHTLQVQGVGSDGYIKAANLGVLVEEPVELTTESASGLLWWIVGAFLLVLLFLLLLLARRRRSQEQ